MSGSSQTYLFHSNYNIDPSTMVIRQFKNMRFFSDKYSFRLFVRLFVRSYVRLFVRTSVTFVEFASKFCVKVFQVVYISGTT